MTRPKPPPSGTRADETRQRLLRAAIEIFGRQGYEAATTRAIAAAAGVNLQAIPYHFGGKEGLHLAAAEHLAAQVRERVQPVAAAIVGRMASGELREAEARTLLAELLGALAGVLVSPESEPWARFIVREQMDPTEAFEQLHAQLMGPMVGLVCTLVAAIVGGDPGSERVALRALPLIGQVLALRAARAAALRTLGWEDFDEARLEAVRASIADSVAALRPLAERP